MFKSVILAASAAILFSGTAMAADAVIYNEPAPVVVDTFSWTGGYIGVNAGYAGGKFKTNMNEYDADEDEETYLSFKDTASGFIGGIQAGYNWQMNQTIIGIETDFQASGVKSDFNIDGDSLVTTKINWFGTTRARLGYTPVDRFMMYVTGGVAYGKVKTSFFDEVSSSKTKVGYTVGAGAEYAFTNNWTIKSEYLYTDLGKLKFDVYDDELTTNVSTKAGFHTVRVGLNYKF